MTYFPDLTFYSYSSHNPSGTQNVGWLARGHDFDRMTPSEETLDLLWSFCSVSIMQSRGIHECDLCAVPHTVHAVRNGVRLLLGSSEIRVFSREGRSSPLQQRLREMESGGLLFLRGSAFPFSLYAAPTLIYHYVRTHHYKPPDEFLRALKDGPRPPGEEYFERLRNLRLEWNRTSGSAETAVSAEGDVQNHPVFLDES
jgi:hypothetical protein